MATFAIHSAGNATCIGKSQSCKDHHRSSNQLSVSISNCSVKSWRSSSQKVSASSMAVATISVPSSPLCGDNMIPFDRILSEEFDKNVESPRVSEKLDEWMRDSVSDIVKNLNQAPLLVQIYANNNDGSMTEIKTERAVAENWPNVMRQEPSPDGIILVEELGQLEKSLDLRMESEENEESGDGTKAWGVLIQGKGEERECGSACYLLKTSRVGSGGGLGLFCTHFCLVKVQSFKDSAHQQFTDSWLLQ